MQASDKAEFVRVLTGLAAIKRVDMTKEAYEMWWLSMREWDITEFREAASHLIKTCEWMPSPYDFDQLKRLERPSANEAWEMAITHSNGHWRKNRSCGDHNIDSVVSTMGGYQALAMCEIDKLGFLERRFLSTYNDFSDSHAARAALPYLSELSSARIGEAVQVSKIKFVEEQ